MLGTLLLALFCVVLGVALTLAVQYYVLENYFESLPIVGPTDKPTVTQPKLPEVSWPRGARAGRSPAEGGVLILLIGLSPVIAVMM